MTMEAATRHDHHHEHEHHHHHDHRDETLQGWLKTLILLGLATYFAYNIFSGNLSNYINVRFVWLSYVAAGIFLLLGVGNAFLLLRAEKHKRKHDDHDHEHAHGGMSWGALGIVALPLLLGVLVPSRPLGASAVDGDLSLNAASVSSSNLTFTVPPLERNILDWLRVFNTVDDYSELNGEPADLIGFVYSEPSFGENRFMVARFTISCCVADASAIGVPVAWNDASVLQADTWVRVHGAFQVDDFKNDRLPVLQAESVTPVEQPEHPYLYP
jgi:putative membrane protein